MSQVPNKKIFGLLMTRIIFLLSLSMVIFLSALWGNENSSFLSTIIMITVAICWVFIFHFWITIDRFRIARAKALWELEKKSMTIRVWSFLLYFAMLPFMALSLLIVATMDAFNYEGSWSWIALSGAFIIGAIFIYVSIKYWFKIKFSFKTFVSNNVFQFAK